jgi:hypothetical protein
MRGEHPEWSDKLTAENLGCSDKTVRRSGENWRQVRKFRRWIGCSASRELGSGGEIRHLAGCSAKI